MANVETSADQSVSQKIWTHRKHPSSLEPAFQFRSFRATRLRRAWCLASALQAYFGCSLWILPRGLRTQFQPQLPWYFLIIYLNVGGQVNRLTSTPTSSLGESDDVRQHSLPSHRFPFVAFMVSLCGLHIERERSKLLGLIRLVRTTAC